MPGRRLSPGLHRLVAMTLAIGLLAACGTRFPEDEFNRIQRDMSAAQVIEILGEPHEQEQTRDAGRDLEVLRWKYRDRHIEVTLINNLVEQRSVVRAN